jgi:negative regulator of sigma E activity
MKKDMKEQELRDIFHDYRPTIADNDEFMQRLTAQMDAEDAREQQQPRHIPLYRRMLPWAVGIAAAVVVALLIIKEPATTPETSYSQPRLPEYYNNAPSYSEFSSYEDIVIEIERSGRQLEDAIAQL